MYVKILSEIDQKEYDAFAPHPLQSYAWGEARKKQAIDIVRFGFFDGEHLKAVFQMTLHRIPYTKYAIGYIARSVMPHEIVTAFIDEYASTHSILSILWEPITPISFDEKIPKLLKPARYPLFAKWSQIIDLKKTEDELLGALDQQTRYNVNLARRKGVTVEEVSTDEGFKIFTKLYFETAQRQKYFGHDIHFHEMVWQTLKQAGIAHILVAKYEGEPVAACELLCFNNMLYYIYSGSSTVHRNVKGVNLLLWEAILFGKKNNAEAFDLWGSLPPNYDASDPWRGFTEFKKGYGTKFVEYVGSYDQIIFPLGYDIFTVLMGLRKLVQKLKRYFI